MITQVRRVATTLPVLQEVPDLGFLLIRVFYGYFFIPHGLQKLLGWFGGGGPQWAARIMSGAGLEPGLFWAMFFGTLESVGGLLLLLGLFTRQVAVLYVGFMAGAIVVTYRKGYYWTSGGFEVPILLTAVAVAIFLIGPGR